MRIRQLSFSTRPPPALARGDPDAVVWGGRTGAPSVIAKRIGSWCWFRVEGIATYRFPVQSTDQSVECVAFPGQVEAHSDVIDAYYRTVVPLALQVYGLESMHGSAVEDQAGAIALCAPSQTGKS